MISELILLMALNLKNVSIAQNTTDCPVINGIVRCDLKGKNCRLINNVIKCDN
ncbi:MAG: hypothetical protein GW795_08480 [Cyanobacteria bacterium]|nr:hypothetical protein [Cyanobacteria bacterium CG_2015-16_32_12]NCO77617.1 hypothetical protein [Cyanobacteria bacterium CG_2015-22_32_23]NCQ04542.1 hypothetical protein [Cyanobacteria bacterium CG_2015-09_32_10]NCQ41909.1 hypothetical protein [Cyanobacteria bacterium CG_2015-04_32_10]NCS83463.1 hypothetical protein [Cyanobacteria bacterium CG_2015-02_32_10]